MPDNDVTLKVEYWKDETWEIKVDSYGLFFCFNALGGGFCLTPGYGGWEVVLNKTYFLAIMF